MNELRQYMSYLAKPANKCLGPVAVIGPPDANVSLQRFLPLAGANWRGVESRLTESTSRTARSPADRTSASPALGPRGLVGRQCAGHLPFNYRWRSTAAVILGDS